MSEETKPEVTETEPTESPETNKLQAMIAKLDELGITDVEQLENKATAAQESGRLANMVGDLREQIEGLKAQPTVPATNEYDEGVDIDSAIGNAVTKALDEREAKAKKVNVARMKEAQSIRSSKDYNVVGDKFEKFMMSPQANAMLGSGETPTSIFNEMVKAEYRNLMVGMKEAAESLPGNPDLTAIPHVESEQTPPPRTEPADEKNAKMKKIKEGWAGNDEDIDKMLDVLLPSGSLPMPSR